MSIFVTGDTHGEMSLNRLSTKGFPKGRTLTKSDYVIILGDFGIIWKNVPDETEQYWLKWLDEKPWTTLFIDGNHENHPRLQSLEQARMFSPDTYVGKASESVFYLQRGMVYRIDGKRFFVMGGARSTDRASRKEHISWWKDEIPNFTEWKRASESLNKFHQNVDFILTHDIHDRGYEDLSDAGHLKSGFQTYDVMTNLEHIRNTVVYDHWYCGHHHVDLLFKDTRTTIVFNKIIKIH